MTNAFRIKNGVLVRYAESTDGRFYTVTVPEGITRIEAFAFYRCQYMTALHIPDSVELIGEHAFDSCAQLETVRLPEALTVLDDGVFAGCVNLAEIVLPYELEEIGKYAFEGCHQMRRITAPLLPVRVGMYAFKRCYSVTELIHEDRSFRLQLENRTADDILTCLLEQDYVKCAEALIRRNHPHTLASLLAYPGLFTAQELESLVQSAIEHAQNGGSLEPQLMLMEYQNRFDRYLTAEDRFHL